MLPMICSSQGGGGLASRGGGGKKRLTETRAADEVGGGAHGGEEGDPHVVGDAEDLALVGGELVGGLVGGQRRTVGGARRAATVRADRERVEVRWRGKKEERGILIWYSE